MSVDIERLCGPEHQDREEIGTGNECNDESQAQRPGFLLQPCWKDRVLGAIDLPKGKCDQQEETNEQWREDMCRGPGILCRMSRWIQLISQRALQRTMYPPHCSPAKKTINPVILRKPPTKSTRSTISARVKPAELTRGGGK